MQDSITVSMDSLIALISESNSTNYRVIFITAFFTFLVSLAIWFFSVFRANYITWKKEHQLTHLMIRNIIIDFHIFHHSLHNIYLKYQYQISDADEGGELNAYMLLYLHDFLYSYDAPHYFQMFGYHIDKLRLPINAIRELTFLYENIF